MFALTLLVYWLVVSGETSSLKPQQRPTAGLAWLPPLLLSLPPALAQGVENTVLPEGQHGGTRSRPSEMLICCPDLAALGEWRALTNG